MTNERGQEQFRRRLRAVFNGKEYIYNVVFRDPEDTAAPDLMSHDMTEEKVRELAAAEQWPVISDIDKVLYDAREAADARRQRRAT